MSESPASQAANATSGTQAQPAPAPAAPQEQAPQAAPAQEIQPNLDPEVDLLDPVSRRDAALKAYQKTKTDGVANPDQAPPPPAEPEAEKPAGEPEPAVEKPADQVEKPPEDDIPEKTWAKVIEVEQRSREVAKENESLKAENESLRTQGQEIENLKGTQQWIAQFKTNPYAALESIGVTYEGWTEYRANGGQPGPTQRIQQLEQELAELKGQGAKAEEQKTAEEQKDLQKRVAEYGNDVRGLMKNQDLAYLAKFGTAQDVVDYAGLHFRQTNQLLDPAAAARAMNEYFKQQNPDWSPDNTTPEVGEPPPVVPASRGGETKPPAPAPAPEANPAEQTNGGVRPLRTLDTDTGPTDTITLDLSPDELADPEVRRQKALERYRATKQG